MPQSSEKPKDPHGEKEQMTEPQDEFLTMKGQPSKDISEVTQSAKGKTAQKKSDSPEPPCEHE